MDQRDQRIGPPLLRRPAGGEGVTGLDRGPALSLSAGIQLGDPGFGFKLRQRAVEADRSTLAEEPQTAVTMRGFGLPLKMPLVKLVGVGRCDLFEHAPGRLGQLLGVQM